MKPFDQRTVQVLLTALVFWLGLLFLYAAWRAIIAFLFAIFFAYLLEAPVSRLQIWFRGSRNAAIAVVYLVFFSLLVLVFALAGPPVAQEAQKLIQQAPQLAKNIDSGQLARQTVRGKVIMALTANRQPAAAEACSGSATGRSRRSSSTLAGRRRGNPR